MKTLICEEPGSLHLVRRQLSERPAGNWVKINVDCVGICGTDFHIYQGNQPYLSYPRVMGHELTGTLAEDEQSKEFSSGDRVVIAPYYNCGECRACKVGRTNCCENLKVLGVHTDGGMCEQIWVPEDKLLAAKGLKAEEAAMVEFLAIGRHAVARSRVKAGQKALVVGAGPIGLAAAVFAQLAGAYVLLADVSHEKVELAKSRFGIDTVEIGPNFLESYRDHFDFVFDATGNLGAMNGGLNYVAHGGTYVLVSIVLGQISFDDPEFHRKETTLLASRNATIEDLNFVIQAIRDGDVQCNRFLTHKTTLDEAALNIANWSSQRQNMIKSLITL